MSLDVSIDGLDELREVFSGVLLKDLQKLNAQAVQGIAQTIVKNARAAAPVDTGKLRKNIKAVRRNARDKNNQSSSVYVNQRAFYWRFIEHGTAGSDTQKPQPERPFFLPAINAVRADIKTIYREQVYKQLTKKLKAEMKKRGA